MPRVAKGHTEQLPSGSFRVSVYAGTDPLTRRQIRLKSTVKTGQQAHIELGRLLRKHPKAERPSPAPPWRG
jgi:integrase